LLFLRDSNDCHSSNVLNIRPRRERFRHCGELQEVGDRARGSGNESNLKKRTTRLVKKGIGKREKKEREKRPALKEIDWLRKMEKMEENGEMGERERGCKKNELLEGRKAFGLSRRSSSVDEKIKEKNMNGGTTMMTSSKRSEGNDGDDVICEPESFKENGLDLWKSLRLARLLLLLFLLLLLLLLLLLSGS